MACRSSAGSDEATSDAGVGPAVASDPIADLRPYEEEMRRALDFTKPPSAETGLGADPWALRRVPGGWVGILRGRSAVVLLDDDLRELARLPAPRSPTGLAVAKNGEVLVVGELSPSVARFAAQGRTLAAVGETRVPAVAGLRDVAISPAGAVWVADERGARVLRITTSTAVATVLSNIVVGHGPVQLIATAKHVVASAVTEHTITVVPTDASGAPTTHEPVRIRNDGPFWGFDARETEGGLIVVAGGVEDHPLDRKRGFFGWIDSYVFAYRVHDTHVSRIAAIDVSDSAVITPKALAIERAEGEHLDLLVTGYGSPTGLRLALDGSTVSKREPLTLVPGIRAVERVDTRLAMADPLLDAWVLSDARGLHVVPIHDAPPRSVASRLGEVLFFTSLMAPGNASTGALSRFTCETCHFEGYVDGRTHHTGREEIHATTKPLVGLVGNRPYFTRALDPDLSSVAHAEFRVAGAGNPVDPFFSIEPRDHAWLEHLDVREQISPLELRRALMRFLVELSHRPNPATVGRSSLSPLERDGATLFRDRCEGCHAARLSADAPSSRVPFERWESLVMAEAAPIVWGSAGYQRTGVLPYVHEDGARTPSLRRLYKKYPYLTNGSAHSIDDVLERMRFTKARTFHANGPEGSERLDDASKRALAAFLEVL